MMPTSGPMKNRKNNEATQLLLGVFMIIVALVGAISPILEMADMAFAGEISRLSTMVDASGVATDVTGDVAIDRVEELSNLDEISTVDSGLGPEESPLSLESPISPGDLTPEPIEPTAAPETPTGEPVAPTDVPATPIDASLAPTDEATPNGNETPEQSTPEPPSKYDSGIDLNQDEQKLLEKVLNESPVSETPKEIAPQEPIQAQPVLTTTEQTSMDDITTTVTDANGNVESVTTVAKQTDEWGNATTTTEMRCDPNGNGWPQTTTVTDENGGIQPITTQTFEKESDEHGLPIETETNTQEEYSFHPADNPDDGSSTIHEETTTTITENSGQVQSVTKSTTDTISILLIRRR